MILKKKYVTLTGIQKRVDFENAHSNEYIFKTIRFLDGEIDKSFYDRSKSQRYHWQLEREKRKEIRT